MFLKNSNLKRYKTYAIENLDTFFLGKLTCNERNKNFIIQKLTSRLGKNQYSKTHAEVHLRKVFTLTQFHWEKISGNNILFQI